MSKQDHTFVVQLDEATVPTSSALHGRVEHLRSGRIVRFTSSDSLLSFLAEKSEDVKNT